MSSTQINSVRFEDSHDRINPMDNVNDYTHLIDAHKELVKEDDEEEQLFEDTTKYTITGA